MAVYGYNRTSTKEQHLDRGNKHIADFCRQQNMELIEIYTDQQTGKNFDRPEYVFIRKRLRQGDILIISEIDRLGRNKEGILRELREFKERGVRVMILEIPTTLMDLRSLDDALGKMLLEAITNMLIEMYATLAEAEMHKREKRQAEGYERLRRNGEWEKLGRPRRLSMQEFAAEYQNVLSGHIRPCECMRRLGIVQSTYYRYITEYNRNKPI